MPTDLFRPRSPSDPAHPMLALPGSAPGTVALEADDGNAVSYIAYEVFVDVTDGRTTSRIFYGVDLRDTLVVTDSRVVFASTKLVKAFKGTRGQTVTGHVRYEWLEGLDGASFQFTLIKARPSYLRLFARDPADPDWLFVAAFLLGRSVGGKDVAADVARRADARRRQTLGADAAGFATSELHNGGTRWLAQNTGSENFRPVVDALSAKGLGALGVG